MPAYILADIFARHFWKLVAGRGETLSLSAYRSGYILPACSFTSDGRNVRISCATKQYNNPDISFYSQAEESVSRFDFEAEILQFIDATLKVLADRNVASDLSKLMVEINQSLSDEDERIFCEAASAFGQNPYLISDEDANIVLNALRLLTDDAPYELLATRSAYAVKCGERWLTARKIEHSRNLRLDLPASQTRADDFTWGRKAWDLGYAVAKTYRAEVGISPTDRFKSPHALAKKFGNQSFEFVEEASPSLKGAAFRDSRGNAYAAVVKLNRPTEKSFALARCIGDHAIFGTTDISPITTAESYRQAAGRAFAAELLAPADQVGVYSASGLTTEEIAAEFAVSPLVIAWQQQNKLKIAAALPA